MTPVAEPGRRSTRPPRGRYTLLLVGAWVLLCLGAAAQAAQQSPVARWPQIKEALLGSDRVVDDGAQVIALTTPSRAHDAAVVPVDIATRFAQTASRHIRKLYLIIDNNPSPVAAVFEFPGDRDWKSISTRVRINAYTDVRAIAELNTGETYMITNFVKASGGCSAPALKDPAAAARELGRMKLIVPREDAADELLLARLMVRHPNSSGLQFDQISRHFIPADYVRTIEVQVKGSPLFKVATDISISENPTIAFGFAGDADDGPIAVKVTDSEGRRFAQEFPLAPATP